MDHSTISHPYPPSYHSHLSPPKEYHSIQIDDPVPRNHKLRQSSYQNDHQSPDSSSSRPTTRLQRSASESSTHPVLPDGSYGRKEIPHRWTEEDEDAEREFLSKGMIDWKRLKGWRFWIRKEWWYWYIIAILCAVLVILMSLYHDEIVKWMTPFANWMKDLPGGWAIPIGIFFVLSFPPLFGHEILAVLVGAVWGLWIGFGITAAGTLLGEMGNFYAFKYCLRSTAKKYEKSNINYACMAHVVRDGGFWMIFIIRLSAIPGHFSTAVFATCGIGFWIFTIACVLTLPKQLIVVYLGVMFAKDEDTTSKEKWISHSVLAVGFVITIWAAWYIWKKMHQARIHVWRKKRIEAASKGLTMNDVSLDKHWARPTMAENVDDVASPILLHNTNPNIDPYDDPYNDTSHAQGSESDSKYEDPDANPRLGNWLDWNYTDKGAFITHQGTFYDIERIPNTLSDRVINQKIPFPTVTWPGVRIIGDRMEMMTAEDVENKRIKHRLGQDYRLTGHDDPELDRLYEEEGRIAIESPAFQSIPTIQFDNDIHYAKTPRSTGEIQNLIATRGVPKIVQLIGKTSDGKILTKLYGQNITEWIRDRSMKIPKEWTNNWVVDIAQGLANLHHRNILHRDLTINNVLFRRDHAIICDLGSVGTTGSAQPPEYVQRREFDKRSDIYGFGTLLWSIENRNMPRSHASLHCTGPFKDIMARCLATDPAARPTVDDILLELKSLSSAPTANARFPEPKATGAKSYKILNRQPTNATTYSTALDTEDITEFPVPSPAKVKDHVDHGRDHAYR
ncbi:uncharacterized protein IL334_005074 [Kwoniella shivajii]|uniref:Golgi apparatus membrane protein TVP38 n=1 Tax=Kwoniella shivajii TaxID=564305 RepID=A0ABZ1D3K7_9TREE|nr:hypothetical protein IL334_005074 [Kwoniella shivajii]